MSFLTEDHKVMERKIETWAPWARRLTDYELTRAARRVHGKYLDRLGPRQWAVLLERTRRLGEHQNCFPDTFCPKTSSPCPAGGLR